MTQLCESCGYRVLKKNLRLKWGEIDILAEHRGVLVVMEVRSRRAGGSFPPSWNLHPEKQQRLRVMAEILGRQYHLPVRVELWELRGERVRVFRVD